MCVCLVSCRHVSADVLPPNLGGTGLAVGQAKEERDLYDLIASLNSKPHIEAQPAGAT